MLTKFSVLLLSACCAGSLCLGASAAEAATRLQGRCVAIDEAKGTLTLVRDKDSNPASPNFEVPAQTYEVPGGVAGLKAGKRLRLDMAGNTLSYYDLAAGTIKTLDISVFNKIEFLDETSPYVKGKTFPSVDAKTHRVSTYSKRQKLLVEFEVSTKMFELPIDTFESGETLTLEVDGTKVLKIEK